MPRREPAQVKTFHSENGLTAAAVRLTRTPSGSKRIKKPKVPPWYSECWGFFNTIGEYRYACTWVGNLLSRAELVIWKDGKLVEAETDPAVQALAAFFGGREGQREMLRQTGLHMTVAADLYLLGEDQGTDAEGNDRPDRWRVVSATRLKVRGQTKDTDGVWTLDGEDLNDPLVIRLWRQHPENPQEADSPSRAILPVLRELDALGKMVASQIASRLTGAGLLLIPNEMSFGSVRGTAQNGDGTDAAMREQNIDAFLIELMETIMAATEDPADPASRTPILFQGPGEHLDKVRLVTFWTELQKEAKNLRDEQIRRLGLGMDMPPEVLTGTAEMNHWNAWQVEEASIKAHTEPLLFIVTSAITETYLVPYLVDNGMSEAEARTYVVHADTTKIRLRPNRSKEALELYDRGMLSLEATAKENGFDTADLMDEEGRSEFFKRKVASGSTTPELVAWALQQLGLTVPNSSLVVKETQTEAPSDRSLREHPENALPERKDDGQDAAVAAANVVVFRALEKAGARLRTKYASALVPGVDGVPNEKLYRYARIEPHMVDDLLAGAWDCLESLDLDVSPLVLDRYVRSLFATSQTHVVASLKMALRGVS